MGVLLFLTANSSLWAQPSPMARIGFAFEPQNASSLLVSGKAKNPRPAGEYPSSAARKTPSCEQDGVFQLYSPAASSMHFVRDMSFGHDIRFAS